MSENCCENFQEKLDKNIKENPLARLGVTKPYTVFVMIAVVLLLGIFSFTTFRMELFPNMNLPFVLIFYGQETDDFAVGDPNPFFPYNDIFVGLGQDPQTATLSAPLSLPSSRWPAGTTGTLVLDGRARLGPGGLEFRVGIGESERFAGLVEGLLGQVQGINHVNTTAMEVGGGFIFVEFNSNVSSDTAIARVNQHMFNLDYQTPSNMSGLNSIGMEGVRFSRPTTMTIGMDMMPVFIFTTPYRADQDFNTARAFYLQSILPVLDSIDGVGMISSPFDEADSHDFSIRNGAPVFRFTMQQTSDSVTTEVVRNIRSTLADLNYQFPGFTYNVTLDQGMYIEESIGGVMMNLLLGALFAIIILFLFMRSWKITLAIAIAIPFSIIGTFVLMFFMGITLNVVSMSGLALVVGLLVDNSIIVLENIFRLKQKGLPIREAAIKGASQIMNAIIAATITTISVFFPMFFVTGLIMQVFMDLVWVIVFSLASSLLVALMFLPGIISSFKIGEEPKPKTKIGASFSNFFTRIDTSITNALQKPRDFTVKTYNKVLNSAVRFKWATLGIAIVLFIGSAFLLMINGFILMPPTDTGEFGMTISVNNDFTAIAKAEAATGDRARVRAELTRPLEVYIRNELNRVIGADNVNTVVVSMGGGGGMIGMLGGGGSSISVDVVLEDRRNISTAEASEVAYLAMNNFFLYRNMMPTIDEEPKNTHLIRGVSMSASMDMMVDDTVSVTIAAPAARPTEEQVNMLGHAIEFLRYELRDVEGVLRIESDFANRPIRDGAGNIIGFQPQRLQRQDRRVVASLTLSIEQDAVISQVQGRVDSLLNELFGNEENTNEYGVLNGITQVESGFAAQMNDSFVQLALAIIIGFILVYLVLVAMFQSFKTPFVVMVTVPLAFTGGFFLLTVAGLPLSIPAMIGLMILMGVITNNGIVLIDYINKSRDDGMTIREAVIAGANVRARPVLMTAISTIIALIPLAAGMGQGGELMQPLAIISIGGLVYATAMSLLVVPALYSIMFFKKDRQEQKEGVIINHEQVNSSELENEQKKGRGTRVSKGLPTKNAEVKP